MRTCRLPSEPPDVPAGQTTFAPFAEVAPLDPYDNALIMPLRDFVAHPVVQDLLSDGAAMQVGSGPSCRMRLNLRACRSCHCGHLRLQRSIRKANKQTISTMLRKQSSQAMHAPWRAHPGASFTNQAQLQDRCSAGSWAHEIFALGRGRCAEGVRTWVPGGAGPAAVGGAGAPGVHGARGPDGAAGSLRRLPRSAPPFAATFTTACTPAS